MDESNLGERPVRFVSFVLRSYYRRWVQTYHQSRSCLVMVSDNEVYYALVRFWQGTFMWIDEDDLPKDPDTLSYDSQIKIFGQGMCGAIFDETKWGDFTGYALIQIETASDPIKTKVILKGINIIPKALQPWLEGRLGKELVFEI